MTQQQTHESVRPSASPSRTRRTPPMVSGRKPFKVGHTLEFIKDPLGLLARGRREHGDVFGFEVGGQSFACLSGPDAQQAYFSAHEDHLSAKEVYQFTIPIFGRGIAYDASHAIFEEQLGFLYPALRDSRMRTYATKMQAEAEAYFAKWRDGDVVDLPVAMNELTVYIASRCLLGDEIRERIEAGFAAAYHDIQGGINAIGFFAPHLPTPTHRKRDKARKKIVEIIGGVVRERRRTGRTGEDFLQSLMEAKYKEGRPLTEDEITGLLLTVLFGGQHTSAVLATWTGLLLAQHPHHFDRLRGELARTYPHEIEITLDSLKKQEHLDRCVKEAERMHPPLIMLVRKVLKDFEYGGITLPAGTLAMVSPGMSHRIAEVFANPHVFDPDRFAPPREEDKVRYSMIGFGGGKHRCVGLHFAYMQLKAIFTVLLSRFQLELITPMPTPDFSQWVTGPHDPCPVRVRRIELPAQMPEAIGNAE